MIELTRRAFLGRSAGSLGALSLSRVIITMTQRPHFATLATITSPPSSDTNGHGKLYGNGNHEKWRLVSPLWNNDISVC